MAMPHFDAEDRKRIHGEIEQILDNSLSMGANVAEFEKEFAARVGVRYAIAMNSCTSALEASLLACNVHGREVIVPSETFIATGMAVHLVGGKVVFAEISEKTFCLDFEDVKNKVTPQTAAIILVHMAGLITPQINELRALCVDHGIFLIEDAAHAPGACYQGKEAGSLGHVGCFSFYPTKVMTTGEGGMLTTNDDHIAAFARSFQHRGRHMTSSVEQYIMPGRNVRMTEVAALLGRVQLSHLDEFLARRRYIASTYHRELKEIPEINMIFPEDLESSTFWKLPILLAPHLNRAMLTERMIAAGIMVDWAYQPPLHLQPVFKELYGTTKGMLPKTEALLSRHICLPCHPQMTDEDALFVARTFRTMVR